ncbi:MAG: hypothetical protein MK137_00570 [Rickettsiales bacterium]|nr:hypothetical protein [Rickettsiales bacterium]
MGGALVGLATSAVIAPEIYQTQMEHRARERHRRNNTAASTIQNVVRKRLERKHDAATLIQKHQRGHVARDAYETHPNTIYRKVRGRVGNSDVLDRIRQSVPEQEGRGI